MLIWLCWDGVCAWLVVGIDPLINEAELLLCEAYVVGPYVALAFKVTVIPDFYLEVCGLALKELVFTFELLLTEVWFIWEAVGSGDVSSTRLPLMLPNPVKTFFFWIYEVLFTRTDLSGVQGVEAWTWLPAFVPLLELMTVLLLDRAREELTIMDGSALTFWLLFWDLLSKLILWPR